MTPQSRVLFRRTGSFVLCRDWTMIIWLLLETSKNNSIEKHFCWFKLVNSGLGVAFIADEFKERCGSLNILKISRAVFKLLMRQHSSVHCRLLKFNDVNGLFNKLWREKWGILFDFCASVKLCKTVNYYEIDVCKQAEKFNYIICLLMETYVIFGFVRGIINCGRLGLTANRSASILIGWIIVICFAENLKREI